MSKRKTAPEIVAETIGAEEDAIREYQPGRHHPRIFTDGDTMWCVAKDPADVGGYFWKRERDQSVALAARTVVWYGVTQVSP